MSTQSISLRNTDPYLHVEFGNPAERIPEWFAVYTTPRHEKRVAEHFACRSVEYFLPLYRSVSHWKNGEKKEVQLPLFPSYIFARLPKCQRVKVLETPGVLDIVSRGRDPIPLAAPEIESLRSAAATGALKPHPFLTVGQRVRIKRGALEGFEGILLRQKNEFRVVCTMELIAQSMAVEVDIADIEPAGSSRPPSQY